MVTDILSKYMLLAHYIKSLPVGVSPGVLFLVVTDTQVIQWPDI